MTPIEKLAYATKFTLQRRGNYAGEPQETIMVEWRGDDRWVVSDSLGNVYNTDCQWEYEPSPSNRDKDFIARTRFSQDRAFEIGRSLMEKSDETD